MRNKYNIGESIEVIGSYIKTKITDFEIFDDLVLYYTEDGQAYPHFMIQSYGFNFLSKIFKTSDKEKNEQVKKAFSFLNEYK
jgi:hypothetical protein